MSINVNVHATNGEQSRFRSGGDMRWVTLDTAQGSVVIFLNREAALSLACACDQLVNDIDGPEPQLPDRDPTQPADALVPSDRALIDHAARLAREEGFLEITG